MLFKTLVLVFSLFEGLAGASPVPTAGSKIRVWPIAADRPFLKYYVSPGHRHLAQLAQESFQDWESVGDAYVRFKELTSISENPDSPDHPDIRIHVLDLLDNSFAAAQAIPEVDLETGYIIQCTVEIPRAYAGSIKSGILLHEIGHCLGLVHSVVKGAVMSYRGGDGLTTDDRFILAQLYPETQGKFPMGCATIQSVNRGGSDDRDGWSRGISLTLGFWCLLIGMLTRKIRGMNRVAKLAAVGLALLVVTGCSGGVPGGGAIGFVDLFQREWDSLLSVLQGGRSQMVRPVYSPPAVSAHEQKGQANAELLREVFLVVLRQEPRAGEPFASFLASLNQGASFEGLYNGFTHSSSYRKLEANNPGPVSAKALAFFAEQLTDIETLLIEKTKFNSKSAEPLAPMMSFGEMEQSAEVQASGRTVETSGNGVTVVEFGKKKKEPSPEPSPLEVAQNYQVLFKNASIYTLKRVLSDEVLKLLDGLRVAPSREGVARWYGIWAAGMNRYGVSYGLALRNRADATFHEQWALKAEPDALTWEVLNRIHRTLNQLESGK